MMKLLNKKQKNNGGFSLVELIVVIAIMVVLVAVLAPLFTRYIESSRRSTDVQNANAIAEGVLADIAEGTVNATTVNARTEGGTCYKPTAVGEIPKVKGDKVDGAKDTTTAWTIDYNATTNKCAVKIGTYDLADADGADQYKQQ